MIVRELYVAVNWHYPHRISINNYCFTLNLYCMKENVLTASWVKIVETILAILSSIVPFLRRFNTEENE